jgi:hypothetical protein
MQSEQVAIRPAERGGLLAPRRQEPAAVLDCLLPAVRLDVLGAATFEDRENLPKFRNPPTLGTLKTFKRGF